MLRRAPARGWRAQDRRKGACTTIMMFWTSAEKAAFAGGPGFRPRTAWEGGRGDSGGKADEAPRRLAGSGLPGRFRASLSPFLPKQGTAGNGAPPPRPAHTESPPTRPAPSAAPAKLYHKPCGMFSALPHGVGKPIAAPRAPERRRRLGGAACAKAGAGQAGRGLPHWLRARFAPLFPRVFERLPRAECPARAAGPHEKVVLSP